MLDAVLLRSFFFLLPPKFATMVWSASHCCPVIQTLVGYSHDPWMVVADSEIVQQLICRHWHAQRAASLPQILLENLKMAKGILHMPLSGTDA